MADLKSFDQLSLDDSLSINLLNSNVIFKITLENKQSVRTKRSCQQWDGGHYG